MTAIPCKRPNVTVEPSPEYLGLFDHVCHVPGCGWTYRSVKSDHLGAPHHRQAHRDAVPGIVDDHILDVLGRVQAPGSKCQDCGWRSPSTCATKADVRFVVEDHLTHVHGLVVCS